MTTLLEEDDRLDDDWLDKELLLLELRLDLLLELELELEFAIGSV